MNSRLVVALAVAGAVACLSGCYTTAPTRTPSGAALEIKTHDVRVPARIASNGDIIPAHDEAVFDDFYEGSSVVDDELDFYFIAGDQTHVKKLVEWREQYNRSVLVGWTASGVAAGLVVGGLGVIVYGSGGKFDEVQLNPTTQVGLGMAAVGGLLFGVTFYAGALFAPEETLHAEGQREHLFPLGDAYTAAAAYNSRGAGGASTPTETSETEAPTEPAP